MHLSVTLKILGILLMMFSLTMLPPAIISIIYEDQSFQAFFTTFLTTLTTGFLLWLSSIKKKQELRTRDGFIIVILFWTVLGLFGSLPFVLMESPISITNAVFESMSGLTTTGATVLTHIDDLPKSILYYRQQLQWFGGMGIIVLAVAILPMLGIGGMQLYRAETPGPVKDSKLTPRITETAKALWYVYLSLTLCCAFFYWVAGMSLFDAICHSFSTIAIGGFSTHDQSIGYFDSSSINIICTIFMFFSAANFALHYFSWHRKNPIVYFKDPEFRVYAFGILLISIIACTTLLINGTYDSKTNTIIKGVFEVVSIATTTGFSTTDFSVWPTFLPILLFGASFAGGCAGSTGGGIKIIRVLLIIKQGLRELKRLIHPSGVFLIKLNDKPVPDRVMEAVWGFFAVYWLVFFILLLMVLATGLDVVSAFSAVAASLNNLGPGLGTVTNHYNGITDFAKWILCFAMLLGRLEIFTLLVLLSPLFWRR